MTSCIQYTQVKTWPDDAPPGGHGTIGDAIAWITGFGPDSVNPGEMLLEEFLKPMGNSPEFWLNLQIRWDLFHAMKKEALVLETIRPVEAAG